MKPASDRRTARLPVPRLRRATKGPSKPAKARRATSTKQLREVLVPVLLSAHETSLELEGMARRARQLLRKTRQALSAAAAFFGAQVEPPSRELGRPRAHRRFQRPRNAPGRHSRKERQHQ